MKKLTAFFVFGALCVSLMSGCGSESATSESASDDLVYNLDYEYDSESTSDDSEYYLDYEYDYEIISGDFEVLDCIEMPEYTGIALSNITYVITDEYIDSYIAALADTEEVEDEDAVVENGDVVNISYEGSIDGELFDGGSSDSYDLEIGSGTFIDGFEDGLLGLMVGDEIDLELTFPEDYSYEDYAGVDVLFHVVIYSISRAAKQDDAWVAEYTDGTYETMDDFRAYVEEYLSESYDEQSEDDLYNDAWDAIYDEVVFNQIPKAYIDEGGELFLTVSESEAISYGLSSADEYFELLGLSEDDINEYKFSYAENYAMTRMFAEALLELEGIDLDGDEVNQVYNDVADNYEMTLDELMENYSETRIYLYGICYVANEVIVNNANITNETEEL